MPTFRTTPSGGLTAAVRRLVASGSAQLGPLSEVQADMAAAQTAQRMSLAEKARAEVEAMHQQSAMRADPAMRTEYAANVAGIDLPDATRLYRAIRGEVDPNPQGAADAADNVYGDVRVTRPENLPAGSERLFRSALASAMANNLATGKTNAEQLAKAGGELNDAALTNQAANTTDVPAANRIVAAVAGKMREPFKLGTQGQVLDQETGAVNEGTRIAQTVANLSGARSATETARQDELGTRSSRNTALENLAAERARAVSRGETGRGGQRVSPQQVERWVSETARKEWETIPPRERKGMNFQQHLDKVRERFKAGPQKSEDRTPIDQDAKDALAAINGGAPAKAVRERFKKRWGVELIDSVEDPTDSGLGAGEDALDEGN